MITKDYFWKEQYVNVFLTKDKLLWYFCYEMKSAFDSILIKNIRVLILNEITQPQLYMICLKVGRP